MAILNQLQDTQITSWLIRLNKVNEHDNNEMRRFLNTHGKGERVKIPLLPNRVR